MKDGRERMADCMELLGCSRHCSGEPKHLMVGQDVCRALIVLPRHRIAPAEENTVARQLRWREYCISASYQLYMRLRVKWRHLVGLATDLCGTLPYGETASSRGQICFHAIVHIKQVVRILSRVGQHVLREGADAPIRCLQCFVGSDATVVLEQVCERKGGQLEHARGLPGVEEANDVETEVALQP